MRTRIIGLLFIICCFTTMKPANAMTAPVNAAATNIDPIKTIHSLNVKELQQRLGRKLKIKERLAFLLLKKQLEHSSRKKPKENAKGQTALNLSIGALALLIIALFTPIVVGILLLIGSLISAHFAIKIANRVKKNDPHDRKARAGHLLAWIVVGLLILTGLALFPFVLQQ